MIPSGARGGRARLVLGSALLLWPSVSSACSVCFSATDENRIAFLLTTIFLSLFPLAMIGGAVLWVRRRVAALDAERAEAA